MCCVYGNRSRLGSDSGFTVWVDALASHSLLRLWLLGASYVPGTVLTTLSVFNYSTLTTLGDGHYCLRFSDAEGWRVNAVLSEESRGFFFPAGRAWSQLTEAGKGQGGEGAEVAPLCPGHSGVHTLQHGWSCPRCRYVHTLIPTPVPGCLYSQHPGVPLVCNKSVSIFVKTNIH